MGEEMNLIDQNLDGIALIDAIFEVTELIREAKSLSDLHIIEKSVGVEKYLHSKNPKDTAEILKKLDSPYYEIYRMLDEAFDKLWGSG